MEASKFTVHPLLDHDSGEIVLESGMNGLKFSELMDSHKALLLRGKCDSLSLEDFGVLVTSLKLEYYPYVGGAAPRTNISLTAGDNIVFTANESPPEEPIPFHHELAQTDKPPSYVFFFCDIPGHEGGETPIIDSTAVYRHASEHHPEFIEKLRKYGARYARTLPSMTDPSSPIGRSYKETWNVATAEELDDVLRAKPGYTWEWNSDGSVRIVSSAVPALRYVAQHNGNFIHQWTFANSIIAAFLGWEDARNDRRAAVRFGDDTVMDEHILEDIANFMEENRFCHKWKAGDIMALNNKLVMHSRNPFVGPRKVYASIWGDLEDDGSKRKISPRGVRCNVESAQGEDPLVFGFWKVGRDICEDVCYQAIASGYRRLDCACDYGNEVEVGRGISRAIADGLCARKDLFITSKLWNTYHKPEHVPLALRRSLEDLQLDYLDEYLIHFPISMEFVPFDAKYPPEWTNVHGQMILVDQDLMVTWKAMESQVTKGLTKTIGVCNFSCALLRQLLSCCKIRPSTLQVELHPYNTQDRLVRFAKERGLSVTAFSVFGASSYVELGMATSDDVVLKNPIVTEIAIKYGKTAAQVLLRWAIQRGTRALHKTITPERMSENRDVFDFYIMPSDIAKIDGLNKNMRFNDPGTFCEPGMGTFCPIYD